MLKKSFFRRVCARLGNQFDGLRPTAARGNRRYEPARGRFHHARAGTVKAKYEGGVFGYPNKKTGTLTIDSMNTRLVFRDGKTKELFYIPFGSITGAYGDTHKVQPAAATVISHVPMYGIPASFIKTKVRYLTIQFDDPDSKAAGVTSFRLENKQILESVLYALATKSGLTKRGEIYIRKKE